MRSLVIGLARRFTTASIKPNKADPNPKFSETYKEALQLEAAKKYVEANRSFTSALDILSSEQMSDSEQGVKIMKRMARNYSSL